MMTVHRNIDQYLTLALFPSALYQSFITNILECAWYFNISSTEFSTPTIEFWKENNDDFIIKHTTIKDIIRLYIQGYRDRFFYFDITTFSAYMRPYRFTYESNILFRVLQVKLHGNCILYLKCLT